MNCCDAPDSQPAGGTAPNSGGHRLRSGLLMASWRWILLGGLALFAFAGPALGVPAYAASLSLVLLCPLSMVVMMVAMGRRGHRHG